MRMSLHYEQIEGAFRRIQGLVNRTPIFTSSTFDSLAGRNCVFKAENLQKTGSFKARGALNAVKTLLEEKQDLRGVITHSSGNHGQALAYAAKQCALKCTVVVPKGAPLAKIEPMKGYGANIVFCEPNMKDRERVCEEIRIREGLVEVHPHNDLNVMAGQGTIAMELLADRPNLDAIIVPIGGGGMASGIAVWAKYINPKIKGQRLREDGVDYLPTIADGIRVVPLGSNCFPVVRDTCEKHVLTVTDGEIKRAVQFVWQRLKLVIEPSSGTGVAAVLAPEFKDKYPECRNVGIILCGGNVDIPVI